MLVALAVLPALWLAWLNYRQDLRLAEDQVRQELAAVAQVAEAGQEAVISGVRNMMETVASGPSVRRTDLRELCFSFLANIVSRSPDFANLGFANRQGNIECMGRRTAGAINVSDRDYFNKVMEDPRFTIGSYMLGRVSRTPALGFGMPVYNDDGQFVGVAFAAVNVNRLADAFGKLGLRPGLHVTLLDRNGVLLATTRAGLGQVGEPLADTVLRQAAQGPSIQHTQLQTREGEAGTWLHDVRPISIGDAGSLRLLVSTRLDERLAPAVQRLQIQLLVLASVLALVLLLAWQLSVRVLAQPIFGLRQRMQAAAAGQFDPADGPLARTREISELQAGFDDMIGRLREGQAQLLRAQRLAGIGFYRVDLVSGRLGFDNTIAGWLRCEPGTTDMDLDRFSALIHPDDRERVEAHRSHLRASGQEGRIQFRIRLSDGDVRWLESFSLARSPGDAPDVLAGALQDVTAAVRLQRLYRLLNAINESIHGATDADSLFHTLCGVAVKAGGFRMAWIGRVDSDGPDGGTRIMPVTSAGVDDGYTDSIQREPDRFVQSRLVAVQALGSGSLAVIDDLAAEPADDWVQAGLERGYRAAAGIPVRQAGTIVAVMVIMSEEPNRFGGPERELLVSLGRSVSRALDFAHAEAQRQQALEAERSAASRLQRAQQLARLGHWVRQDEGRQAEWSEGLYGIIGRDPALGPPTVAETLATLHPDDVQTYRDAMDRALHGNGGGTLRYRCQHADGSIRWYEEIIDAPLRDASGRVLQVSGTVQDITDRMEGALKLQTQLSSTELLNQIARATEERHDLQSVYRVVCEKLDTRFQIDLSLVLQRQGNGASVRVVHVGPAGTDRLAEAHLQPGTELVADRNGLARCLGGELVHEPDTRLLDFDLPRRLAAAGLHSVVLVPLQVGGAVFGVLLVARRRADAFVSSECEFMRQLGEHVTLAAGQARLLESLRQAYDDLRDAQQAALQQERLRVLGQMASGIAHDINNAISPVALYTESLLAREKGLSEQGRQQLTTIQLAVDDVADTVARMREFYRPSAGMAERRDVDLSRLMRQALELTRARWRDLPQQQGISIEIATELVDPCPPVRGVEGELRDALVNLLLNAVDAMPQGGRITLRSRLELTGGGHGAPQLVVEVEDSGIGMDEDTRRRCIEPFFTTKGERGSGLGMAMVFGCLQRHDASLDIDSQPGRGTRVRLQFPVLAPQDGSGAAGLLAQEPAVPRRALDVLLVDDDPLLLEAVGEILSQAGHRVVRASGGRSGVEQFEAALAGRPFDAVITDLGMPEVDGRNVARRVRQLSATTPVIMLTGWGRRMEEDGEMPEGVDLLLSKPPRRRQLLDALDRLAGQR